MFIVIMGVFAIAIVVVVEALVVNVNVALIPIIVAQNAGEKCSVEEILVMNYVPGLNGAYVKLNVFYMIFAK